MLCGGEGAWGPGRSCRGGGVPGIEVEATSANKENSKLAFTQASQIVAGGGGFPGIEVEATSANKENSKLAFTQASQIVAGGGVSLVLRWKQHPQTKRIQNWHSPKQAK